MAVDVHARYPGSMDTNAYIRLPDGSYGAVAQTMSYGDIVIIILLSAMLLLYIYQMWNNR